MLSARLSPHPVTKVLPMPPSQPAWNFDGPILLVGAGKMGHAMLSGWISNGVPASSLLVQDPHPSDDVASWCEAHSVSLAASQRPPRAPAVVILAVKPQAMDEVFPVLAKQISVETVTLSIAAGKLIASYEHHLPPMTAVIRAMPNTPAAIGRGMTVLCANAHVTQEQRVLSHTLMAAVGEVGWVEDESLMDAVTAVSGSGPAYVFLLAETLAAAGVKAGLDPVLANQLARVTIAGAGELMRLSPESAASLRQNVTSPGGTTAAALDVLMANAGLGSLMDQAIAAAVNRSHALST